MNIRPTVVYIGEMLIFYIGVVLIGIVINIPSWFRKQARRLLAERLRGYGYYNRNDK